MTTTNTTQSITLHRGTDPEGEIYVDDAQEIHVNFIMVAELEFLEQSIGLRKFQLWES